MGQFLSVAVAIGVPVVAGMGIGISIKDDVKGWYQKLDKPSWTPPDWLFGPMWTALYTAMGYASYIVWKNGAPTVPLTLYGIQLVLNLAWSPLFFKQKDLGFALLDITALTGLLAATIVEFNKVSPTASYLLVPYLGWVSYATALTYDVWRRNPKERGEKSEKAIAKAAELGEKASDKAAELGEKASDKAHELSDKVQGKTDADKAKDKTKGALNDAKDSAKTAGKGAKDSANEASGKAKSAADKAANKAEGAADGLRAST